MATDDYDAALGQLNTKELFGDIGGPNTADADSPFTRAFDIDISPHAAAALHFGCRHAHEALVVGADAFDSLKLLVGKSIHSPSALERMVLEAAATASWLVSPPEEDERVSRADDLRLQLMEDNRKLFDSAGKTNGAPEIPPSVRDSVRQLISEHRAAGRSARTIQMLNVVESQFRAESIYRVLSGRAHGRPWSQEHATRPWVAAFGGDTEPLVTEITHTLRRAMEWLTWGLHDYAVHTRPSEVGRIEQVMTRWGARPRPER